MSEQSLPTSAGSLAGAQESAGSQAAARSVAVAGRPRAAKFDPMTLLTYAYLVIMVLFAVFPLFFVLQASFNGLGNLYTTNLQLLPPHPSLANYSYLIKNYPFFNWVLNSAIAGIVSAGVGLCVATLAGYALSRFRFQGRISFLIFLLALQAFPGLLALSAYFYVFVKLGLYDSLWGLIIAYSVGPQAFGVWNMKGYFDTIPVELEQAAMVDGATIVGAFFRIALPLAVPALATTFLFSIIGVYNEYALAHFLLNGNGADVTFPVGMQSLASDHFTSWGVFAAGSVMASVPLMALFLYLQSYFKSGLTIGSVKG